MLASMSAGLWVERKVMDSAHIGQGLGGIHAADLSLGVIGQRGLEGRVGGGVTQEGNVNGAAS